MSMEKHSGTITAIVSNEENIGIIYRADDPKDHCVTVPCEAFWNEKILDTAKGKIIHVYVDDTTAAISLSIGDVVNAAYFAPNLTLSPPRTRTKAQQCNA